MRLSLLIISMAITSCVSKQKVICSEQDQAVVLQILTSTIDLKIEQQNEAKLLIEDFRTKKIPNDTFEKRMIVLNKKFSDIQQAGNIAIKNFEIDHPECANKEINRYLKIDEQK